MKPDFEQICKNLYRIRMTINELLADRGVDMEHVNTGIGYSQWCGLVEEYQQGVPSLDIQVSEGAKKVYVRFMREFKYAEAGTVYEVCMRMLAMDRGRDDIIMVITEPVKATAPAEMRALERTCANLTIYEGRELLYNPSRHILVPRHKVISKEDKEAVMREYQIASDLQFPVISRTDPQAKYLGARKGEVIKIERPSIGGLHHIIYRIVI